MGTSKGNGGGSGGAWTNYKRNASYFARHGGTERAARALAGFVGTLGGASGAAASASTGNRVGQSLGQLLAGSTGPTGIAGGLEAVGLSRLIGQDKYTVLSELLDAFSGAGGDLEAQAARNALVDVLDELLPADGDFEAVVLDDAAVSELLVRYIAALIYNRAIPVIDERLTRLENPALARQRDKELRDYIESLVRLRTQESNPIELDWQGPGGRDFVERILRVVYEELEGWE